MRKHSMGPDFANYLPIRESTILFLYVEERDHLKWLEIQGETHHFKFAANSVADCIQMTFSVNTKGHKDWLAKPVMHIRNPITCKTLMFKRMKRDDECATNFVSWSRVRSQRRKN